MARNGCNIRSDSNWNINVQKVKTKTHVDGCAKCAVFIICNVRPVVPADRRATACGAVEDDDDDVCFLRVRKTRKHKYCMFVKHE